MLSFSKAFFLALMSTGALLTESASFEKDVMGGAIRARKKLDLDILSSPMLERTMEDPSSDLHQDLLAKALPIRDFEKKYGVDLQSESSQRQLANQGNDDFAMNGYNMISFSGYSLKFAKCQPVQYFSERAIQMGEFSPMITNDIVVLRLCPTNSCSESAEYGCQYNFSEYAMELAEYVRIMLNYAATKRDYMCNYCDQCLNNGRKAARRLADEGGQQNNDGNQNQANNQEQGQQQDQQQQNNNNNNNNEQQQQQQQQNNNDNNGNQQANNDDYNNNAANDDNYNGGNDYYYDYSANACNTWNTYCGDYADLCVENQQNGGDEDVSMAYEDYLNYLYCSEVNYNNYAYFVKPRCDGYQGTIKMGIFYDKYCNQYAGNEVSLKNVGMGFRESAFQDFYSTSCMDCSESDYPPYDATSTLCNRLHLSAARCTEDMAYDLFGDDTDDSTECSFIESIRFGTYNELGQLTTRDASGAVAQEVTDVQMTVLGISVALCVGLVIYACYLHHAMTNLLIKSLSHRELLPPSRQQSRQRGNMNNSPRRSGRRLKKVDNNEPDWDDDNGGEYA